MNTRQWVVLAIIAALVLLLIAEIQANTLPGAAFGCTYGPLPFNAGHWPLIGHWLQWFSEVTCNA